MTGREMSAQSNLLLCSGVKWRWSVHPAAIAPEGSWDNPDHCLILPLLPNQTTFVLRYVPPKLPLFRSFYKDPSKMLKVVIYIQQTCSLSQGHRRCFLVRGTFSLRCPPQLELYYLCDGIWGEAVPLSWDRSWRMSKGSNGAAVTKSQTAATVEQSDHLFRDQEDPGMCDWRQVSFWLLSGVKVKWRTR